jgi:hypothetical protein
MTGPQQPHVLTAATSYHTEIIDLPSGGWFYPQGNPLASGQIELRYMTAKDEDILTSTNLIRKGVVFDRLMQSLIVDKTIDYNDLLIGDKNAIMIASRILAYGKEYSTTINCPECSKKNEVEINLQELNEKNVTFDPTRRYVNEFYFELPIMKKRIAFKLLTHGDEQQIDAELESIRKFNKSGISPEVTTRMRRAIVAIDGNREIPVITDVVVNMPAQDARAFRQFARDINPDVDMTFDFGCVSCGHEEKMEVPMDVNFFWPGTKL